MPRNPMTSHCLRCGTTVMCETPTASVVLAVNVRYSSAAGEGSTHSSLGGSLRLMKCCLYVCQLAE